MPFYVLQFGCYSVIQQLKTRHRKTKRMQKGELYLTRDERNTFYAPRTDVKEKGGEYS